MITTLADPMASRAVLIGVHAYEHLHDLPAVARNVMRLGELFQDPAVWGLPPAHCRAVSQPHDGLEIMDAVCAAADGATDTLLIYFAGHGLVNPSRFNDLLLALPGASTSRLYATLQYDWIRQILLEAQAIRKVVILDCCYSGRALTDIMTGSAQLADKAMIEGTAIITAASEYSPALALPGHEYTAFTGELIAAIANGIEGGPEILDINNLYSHLLRRLEAAGWPKPQQRNRNSAGSVAFARNRAFTPPRVTTVAEADPFELGVHRAITTGDGKLPPLTQYLPREHDRRLDELLGAGTPMIVLVGEALTGKSRAALEAARRSHPGRVLLRPKDSGHLLDLTVEGGLNEPVVLWLDNAVAFLTGEFGEAVCRVLERLLVRGTGCPVTILGTMSPGHWQELVAEPLPGSADASAARDLMRHHAQAVFVPDSFAPLPERNHTDPRIAGALRTVSGSVQLIQALTGAEVLLRLITGAQDAAGRRVRAVISVVMDARLLGHAAPVPLPMLAASSAYLEPQDLPDANGFASAIAEAARPRHGVSPLVLTDGRVRLNDYLERHALETRDPAAVPQVLWDALAEHAADPDDCLIIAANALLARRTGHAFQILLRVAEDTGDRRALDRLSRLIAAPELDEADPVTVRRVADVLEMSGRPREAEEWWVRGAARGDAVAMLKLADLLERFGREPEAELWWRQAADRREAAAQAVPRLAELLERTGRVDETEQWWRRAAEAGDPLAAGRLADLLEGLDRLPEAELWWPRAGVISDVPTMMRLAERLAASGQLSESMDLWTRAAESGETEAMLRLAELVATPESEQWLRRAAEAGSPEAARWLGRVLESRFDLGPAEVWLRRAAVHGERQELADFLTRCGRSTEAGQVRSYGVDAKGRTRPGLITSAKFVVAGAHEDKTAFVQSLSEVAPLPAESVPGASPVPMDFGRVSIGDDLLLYLFGVPTQGRFWFMWDELVRGAVGAVIVVRPRALAEHFAAIDFFEHRKMPFVIMVWEKGYADLAEVRAGLRLGPEVPIATGDPADPAEARSMLLALTEHVVALRRKG